MELLDGTILRHGDLPYDPVKAHEYYMQTRQLKGRKKGLAQPVNTTGSSTPRSSSGMVTVKLASGKVVKLTSQQMAEQQAYAAKRVGEIKNNLNKLSAELKKKLAEAEKKKKSNQPLTAAEKLKVAQDAKQYRAAHRQKIASAKKIASINKHAKGNAPGKTPGKSKSTVNSVDVLKKKIVIVKGRLNAAVATQRLLMTATRTG